MSSLLSPNRPKPDGGGFPKALLSFLPSFLLSAAWHIQLGERERGSEGAILTLQTAEGRRGRGGGRREGLLDIIGTTNLERKRGIGTTRTWQVKDNDKLQTIKSIT